MADIPGGTWFPTPYPGTLPPSMTSIAALTASTHRYIWTGRVSFKGTGTKNLSRVQFAFGAITKAGGSGLTVSIRDIDATTGQPQRDDGTPDETVAIANGDAGFASSTWYRTGTLSATRTVSNSSYIAVVLEYDGAGRLGADSVVVRALATSANAVPSNAQQDGLIYYNGATYTLQSVAVNLLLEFDDGTFGLLDTIDHVPCSAATTTYSFNVNTVARDEAGFAYTPTFTHDIDALYLGVAAGVTADFDVVLYEGTTALVTVSIDATQTSSTSARMLTIPIDQTTLTSGTRYNVVAKATTTNNVSVYAMSVSDNAHLDIMSGGDNFTFTSRVDGGAFTSPSTTERVVGGVRICGYSASGGGMLVHPGANGRLAA